MECRNVTLEVCTGDLASVHAAYRGGAGRVELCSALSEGGLTPSEGLMAMALKVGIKVNVLIRPREGDFVYDAEEVECMVHDIKRAAQLGCNGVVIGALTSDGDIDMDACKRMMDAAAGMEVTFHRAFDRCRFPEKALEQIIELGCKRLLTSGQAPTALEGVEMIARLQLQAGDRLSVMAGAGVSPENAAQIVSYTGISEIHASAREPLCAATETVKVKMGCNDGAARMVTSAGKVSEIMKLIANK